MCGRGCWVIGEAQKVSFICPNYLNCLIGKKIDIQDFYGYTIQCGSIVISRSRSQSSKFYSFSTITEKPGFPI